MEGAYRNGMEGSEMVSLRILDQVTSIRLLDKISNYSINSSTGKKRIFQLELSSAEVWKSDVKSE